MGQARKLCIFLLGGLLPTAGCDATGRFGVQQIPPPPVDLAVLAPPVAPDAPNPAVAPDLPAVPATQPQEGPLPINLPTALQLAGARAVDVAAASERIRVAAAQLQGARALWLPNITLGGDYNRHDGRIQAIDGTIINASRSSWMFGLGSGLLASSIFNVGDILFAQRFAQLQMRARRADFQAASNDTMVAVTDAYYNVEQARGQLAGAIDAIRLNEALIARTRKLGPNIVPELELYRAEANLAHLRDRELFYREQWKVASAELLRVLRLDPAAQVEPLEPPHLRVELIDLNKPVDDLIPVGLTFRPELASQQAQVQATLTLLKQEKLRPLIPSLLLRGWSTPVTGTLGFGVFGGGTNGSLGSGALREDIDAQLLWQLTNLGFGNLALVRQRAAENRLAVLALFRLQDRVAAEVAQAYAQAQQAARRVEVTENGLRSAILSANKNLEALKTTKGVGDVFVTLVRPQEVVAAIQALLQTYSDYYAAVADANRAQFRLYRALGQPAQFLAQQDQSPKPCAPDLPPQATLAPPTDEILPTPRLQTPVPR